MKARNKRTGVECEVHWDMCDMGRKCSATDKPNSRDPRGYNLYNAVVDDYEFFVNGKWIDGLDYIKNPRLYYKTLEEEPVSDELEKEITNEINRFAKYCEMRLSEMEDDDTDISFMDLRHFAYHFINWQKQQMMKDAKNGIGSNDNYIQFDDGTWIDLDPSMKLNPAFEVKEGEKVKVIIIKED